MVAGLSMAQDLIAGMIDTQPERVTDPGERTEGVIRRHERLPERWRVYLPHSRHCVEL